MKIAVVAAVAFSILAPSPTAQDVRTMLNTYLDGYEPKLSELIAATIIRAFDNSDMRSIVSAFVDQDTGRLWRANVITRDPRPTRWTFDHVVSVESFLNRRSTSIAATPATAWCVRRLAATA